MMIYASSEKPKDDLPYEEMSEVRAHTGPHTESFSEASLYLLLHFGCVCVSHRVKRSSLNTSRTQNLLISWSSFSLWRIGKERTASTLDVFSSSRCSCHPQSIWQTLYKVVTQHNDTSQGWIELHSAAFSIINFCDSFFSIMQRFTCVKQNPAFLFSPFFPGKNTHTQTHMFMLDWQGLFRNYGDAFLPLLRPHLEQLASDPHESSQRCVCEITAGLIRGSKHWSFGKVLDTHTHTVRNVHTAPLFDKKSQY